MTAQTLVMSRLLQARVVLHRLSPVWLVLWPLAAALLWTHLIWLPGREAALASDEVAVRQMRAALRRGAAERPERVERGDAERFAAFDAALGRVSAVQQHVQVLFDVARPLGLSLGQGQYALRCEDKAPYCHYKILLPVKAPYPVLKAFVDQSLSALPFASLDEWSLRRDGAGESEFDSRIVLTLHLQAPGEPDGQEGAR